MSSDLHRSRTLLLLRSALAVALTISAVVACGASSPNPAAPGCGTNSRAKVPHDNSCDHFLVLPCSINPNSKSLESAVCDKECPKAANGTKALNCGVDRDANGEPYLGCSFCQI